MLLDKGEVAYGPLQRNKYNNENVEHYDYNLEKSAEIFEAAGCTQDADGYWCRNGERISFTINATPGDQVRIDMAQIAAQQLREAGLDVSRCTGRRNRLGRTGVLHHWMGISV